jgi:hypothetical protein
MDTTPAQDATVQSLLTAQGYTLLDGYPRTAAVGASALLPALFGVTFPNAPEGVRFMLLITVQGDCYLAKATADANGTKIAAGGYIQMPIRAAEASLLALFAAFATRASIMVFVRQ